MEDARVAAPQEDVYEAQIPLPLSEKEKRILELYDRLLELELELALTKARQDTTIGTNLFIAPLRNTRASQCLTNQNRYIRAAFSRDDKRSSRGAPASKSLVDVTQRCR